ncbi:MAG: three-Cys-motif partner protein TcmP [Nitrosotalea sp.]
MSAEIDVWIKEKITPLFEEIKSIKNDGEITSPGNLWSLKKEVALHLYIPSYFNIIKNHFEKWYYYDPFCGSGLFEFKQQGILQGEKFGGSPIVALSQQKKYPFNDYFLSDLSEEATTTLKKRIKNLYKSDLNVESIDFRSSISQVERIDARTGHESCLAFIDPVGYIPIPWVDIERLLQVQTCDLFIVVMTSDLNRNLAIALNPEQSGDQGLTEFLGNESWRECQNGDEIVERYRQQIASYGKFTEVLSVNRVGETKIYDIILTTRSDGGIRVMRGIAEKLRDVTTEKIKTQAITSSGRISSMDSYF